MHDNYFYFKVPFRTDFALIEGNILQHLNDYSKMWDHIKRSGQILMTENKPVNIDYLHNSSNGDEMQFESIDKDSSLVGLFSPMIINVIPGDWIEKHIERNARELYTSCFVSDGEKRIHYVPGSCKITIFKNTLSTIEFCFKLDVENKDLCVDCIKRLERWSNEFSTIMVAYAYSNILVPLINQIRKYDVKYGFFCKPGENIGFPDIYHDTSEKRIITRQVTCGVPLWVSRSLIIGQKDEAFDDLVRRWTISVESKEEIVRRFNETEQDEKNKVYLGWMHSMMLGNINDTVIRDSFFSQGLAQYYYAIFDSLNMNLSQVIGLSHRKKSIKNTRLYKEKLEEMIFVTDLIKVNFADVTQGLQRNRAYFFNILTERWTIDNIMENVRKKILLCKDNINRIYQKTLTKSQKLAALLLFFISGFAILEFLRGLSEFLYGPESIGLDVWGIYNIGQLVGPNSMLWIGMLLFATIFLFYSRLLRGGD